MALPQPLLPDDSVIARIRAGDEDAFEALVLEHYNGLCVFAARLVGTDAAAEEIVQDVLMRIWQRRERWRVGPGMARRHNADR